MISFLYTAAGPVSIRNSSMISVSPVPSNTTPALTIKRSITLPSWGVAVLATTTANPGGRGRAPGPAGDDRRRHRGDHRHDARNETVDVGAGVAACQSGAGHELHPGRNRLGHTVQRADAFDSLFKAVLAALEGDDDIGRCERGKRAALEAAALFHPDALESCCSRISKRLKDHEVKGMLPQTLLKTARNIAGVAVEAGKPDAAVAAMEYLDFLAGKVGHGDEEQADEDDRAAVPTLSPYQFTVEYLYIPPNSRDDRFGENNV